MKINNCKELWSEWMGSEETEERALALLEKHIFKGTECGCVLPLHTLKWGFTIEEFNAALDEADKEGVEAWHEANDEDLERVVDEV